MGKKSLLGTLLTGVALGAAALFLSNEKNRDKAKKVVKKTVAQAKKLEAEYKKNPAKVQNQVTTQGKKLAKKAVAVAKKSVRKLAK
jgi:hypothetical protein